MNDIDGRLRECFAAVFPDETPESLPTLVADECEHWDSLATLTLAALVEEEFEIEIEPEDAPHFVSFAAIAAFLAQA